MVRYCSRCGAVLEQGDVFCKSCGSKQETVSGEKTSFPAADGEKKTVGAASDFPNKNRKRRKAAIVLIITAAVVLIGIIAAVVIINLPSKSERVAGIVNIYCFDEYYTSDMEVTKGEKLGIKVTRAKSEFLHSKADGYTASSLDYNIYSDEIPEDVRSTMFEEIDEEFLNSLGVKELCCYRLKIDEGTSGGFYASFMFGCDIKKPEQAPVPLGILYQPFDGNGGLLTDDSLYVLYDDPNGTINVLYQWLEYLRGFYKAKGEADFNERMSFLIFALNETVDLSGDGDSADALEDELDETGSVSGQQNGYYGDSGDLEAFWDKAEGIWINLDSCQRWGTGSTDVSFELCQFGGVYFAFADYPGEWSRAGEVVEAVETSPGRYTVTLYYKEEEFMDYYYPEKYEEMEVEIEHDRLWMSTVPGVVWSYMGSDWDGAIQAAADYCDKISA